MSRSSPPTLFVEPFVDSWRPDETLFSLASRQHVISCNALAANTCLALFGHTRLGSAHDLPSCIDAFVERTDGALGRAEAIIRERTILPFYLAHRTPRDARNAIAAMRGVSIGPLKAQLGMLAGRFRAHHPLKACPVCMELDSADAGTAHWRIQHQLPGAWVCLEHGVPLLQSQMKSSGVGRFQWYLPDARTLQPPVEGVDPPLNICGRLATCAQMTWALPVDFHFRSAALISTYRRAAAAHGIVSPAGRINADRFAEVILPIAIPLGSIPELTALPKTAKQVTAQFSRLLQQPHAGGHPLRHLVLTVALFDGWESFWTAYQQEAEGRVPDDAGSTGTKDTSNVVPRRSDPRKASALAMLAAGSSATAAAARVGVATGTVLAWAAEGSIATQRRPKRMKPELRKLVVRALARGTEKRTVAEAFGVSIQTITTTLRTEIGLAARWREARHSAAMRKARNAWTKAAIEEPAASATDVRRMAPAAFAWLYRHDRAWLEEQARKRPIPSRSNHRQIDWDERDRYFSQKILEVGLALSRDLDRRRATAGELCQCLPDLKPMLSKLHQLPLTSAALRRVTRQRRSQVGGSLL